MNSMAKNLGSLVSVFVFNFTVVGTGYAATKGAANFEQRKSERLRRLDQRIEHLRDERSCIQGATTQDDLKTCREKFNVGNKERRQQS